MYKRQDYYCSGTKEYTKAIELMEKSITRGCTDASYELSNMYADGLGVAKDEKKAQKLCTDAAEAGSTRAIYELAYNYEYGERGLPIDHKLANEWAEKGIAKGNGDCQALLAHMYVYGTGAQANAEKGLELYRKAVEPVSYTHLASCKRMQTSRL